MHIFISTPMHVALAQAVKGGGPMTRWWLCLFCSCVTVHVTPLGGSEEHLGWCLSFSQFVLMDIFPAVSGWRGACLTMSVKKNGSLLGVGFGVLAIPLLEIAPSCPPGMGHLPHPQWCQLLCTAVSFLCPSRSRGGRGTPTAHFPADTSCLLSLEGRGGWCRQLGS